ncbi:MAG: YgiQ family radical SAM protein [Clostridia bacterium]|nr:YgiQ family radical SAM protein [Clostridia bacterium]
MEIIVRDRSDFLPVSAADVKARGWAEVDFVYVTGDAYVDHPSFGVAIISRVLEAAGFRVAILSQPDYKSITDFKRFGKPKYAFLVSSGNIDSMVAHYTVSKKRRSYDYYTPGGEAGKRPDRAVIVYCNRIREAWGDVPIIIGGLEASLRRFAHYDYWQDKVRRSILIDSRADILTYGMGENIILRIAELLARGVPIRKIRDVRGTVYLASADEKLHYESIDVGDYDELKEDKALYARAFAIQYKNTDSVRGRAIVERYGEKRLVQNPPMPPLEREELDRVYALPYARDYHPDYEAMGGVPAITEVKFSITHNRGCFGACNFCAIAFHQGREVRSRSEESVLREAKLITELPDFKGYINDVGGPTANFRYPSCEKQKESGVCPNRKCLSPTPCKNLVVDHTEYMEMLRKIESLDKVKRVFVRSGIRFDYLLYDKDDSFFRRLVTNHTSGQLKVAPEHCANNALTMMGKPPVEVFEKFKQKFFSVTKEAGLEQYLVPYLMSSHPGATMNDAVEMAIWLKKWGYSPEQVQDFYPTPGTISTVMYYTGINPMTGKRVFVTTDYHEKQLQRALLQFKKPENANLVREALRLAGREELIGTSPECLVRPAFGQGASMGSYEKKKGGSKGGSHAGARTAKKPTAQKKTAYYQPLIDKKKPKPSKIERVFGKDAVRIMREADKMARSHAEGRSAAASKSVKTTKNGKNGTTASSKRTKTSGRSKK